MFRNRWVRRVGTTLAVLVGVLVAAFFYIRHTAGRQGRERLATVTAQTDAIDPHWGLDDLDAARGQMPEAENSARLIPRYKAARGTGRVEAVRPDKTGVFDDAPPPNRRLDDEGIDAIDRTLAENGAARAVAREFRNYPNMILPAIDKMHNVSLRHRAMMRCAGTAVAVERFRQTFGRWPESLAELPKDLLAVVPPDPYDGRTTAGRSGTPSGRMA
jgi:hypothetical protein